MDALTPTRAVLARTNANVIVEVLDASMAGHRPVPDGQTETFPGVMWCDGRRRVDLSPGARVEVRRGSEPVLLARLRGDGSAAGGASFTDRLVAKFGLPVAGWRGRPPRTKERDSNEQSRIEQSRERPDREEEPRTHA